MSPRFGSHPPEGVVGEDNCPLVRRTAPPLEAICFDPFIPAAGPARPRQDGGRAARETARLTGAGDRGYGGDRMVGRGGDRRGQRGLMAEETDRRTQILDAAFEEFAGKGFRGATMKSIAGAAKLKTPALIYWYFEKKDDLFLAVLAEHAPILRVALDAERLAGEPPEEVLPMIARTYLGMAEQPRAQRLLRLILTEVVRRPEVAELIGKNAIGRVLGFLNGYLAHQVVLGRLRPHDTRSSARAFIGMILPQMIGKVALPALRSDGLTDEEHLATSVDLFLRGLRPEAAEVPPRP